jgi:catalase
MAEISPQLVDQILAGVAADFPGRVPGTRPIHTVGIGALGWFRASNVAHEYSSAAHFAGDWIPVRVRFSNGNGQPDPDGLRQVRGMAIRFYPNGTIVGDDIVPRDPDVALLETDLVCMSVPMFMVDRNEDLIAMEKAMVPRKVRRPGLLAKLKALLTMSPLPPQDAGIEMSPVEGTLEWQRHYEKGQAFVLASSMLTPPDSYARTAYHAVHAFELVNEAGITRMARFSIEPSDGVHSSMPLTDERNEYGFNLPADYLRTELRDRLARGPSQFSVRIQVADPWDDPTDPTVVWPRQRLRVLMGTLKLTAVAADQETHCEKMSFNPGRLLPGMGLSADPVLHARTVVYEESQRRRGSACCPVMHA